MNSPTSNIPSALVRNLKAFRMTSAKPLSTVSSAFLPDWQRPWTASMIPISKLLTVPVHGLSALVHHLADCHIIAYTWTRLALTSDETWPMVYDYNVDAIASLPDRTVSVEVSLKLLTAIHQRWSALLRAVPRSRFSTHGYTHPETGPCSLDQMLAMYAWHGSHHLGHIMHCRERNGWK